MHVLMPIIEKRYRKSSFRISKQVIILSTDEEINEEYYEIIKPYIAREYLLVNDENQNRTTVKQHYFFGV